MTVKGWLTHYGLKESTTAAINGVLAHIARGDVVFYQKEDNQP